MDAKELEQFGLTEGEAKVYLALLRLGKSTIGDIIHEAQVSNSRIYDILDRLAKKGFVGVIIENNRRHFEAKSPERLKEGLHERETALRKERDALDRTLPMLKELYVQRSGGQQAELLYGTRGIKVFTERILETASPGDTIYILGAPIAANEMLEGYLLDWQKRRVEKGIKCRILYNNNAKRYAKDRKKLRLTEVRFLPPSIITPVAIDIVGNDVGTILFGENAMVFSLTSAEVAANYRTYFELLWNLSKP